MKIGAWEITWRKTTDQTVSRARRRQRRFIAVISNEAPQKSPAVRPPALATKPHEFHYLNHVYTVLYNNYNNNTTTTGPPPTPSHSSCTRTTPTTSTDVCLRILREVRLIYLRVGREETHTDIEKRRETAWAGGNAVLLQTRVYDIALTTTATAMAKRREERICGPFLLRFSVFVLSLSYSSTSFLSKLSRLYTYYYIMLFMYIWTRLVFLVFFSFVDRLSVSLIFQHTAEEHPENSHLHTIMRFRNIQHGTDP